MSGEAWALASFFESVDEGCDPARGHFECSGHPGQVILIVA